MALSLSSTLEAVLFAAGEPLPKKRLSGLLDADMVQLRAAIDALHDALRDRGLALVETEDHIELRTAPDAASAVEALRESELSRDLGKASLETLALILYKGVATRTEIDWVRGVNSSAALRVLMLRGLIERVENAGDKRRAAYRATVDALAHLGVSTREALPRYGELSALLRDEEEKAAVAAADEPAPV